MQPHQQAASAAIGIWHDEHADENEDDDIDGAPRAADRPRLQVQATSTGQRRAKRTLGLHGQVPRQVLQYMLAYPGGQNWRAAARPMA